MVEEYLDSKDIQRIFNLKSRQAAAALMQTKGFPAMRIGNKYRVLPSELEKWQKRNITSKVRLDG